MGSTAVPELNCPEGLFLADHVFGGRRCGLFNSRIRLRGSHTGREGLLELLGLLGVLEHQGVQVLLAADLELDVLGLGVLLDARGCEGFVRRFAPRRLKVLSYIKRNNSAAVANAFGFCFSGGSKHTGGVLPAADLDELENGKTVRISISFFESRMIAVFNSHLLNIGDFARHFGGLIVGGRGRIFDGTMYKGRFEAVFCRYYFLCAPFLAGWAERTDHVIFASCGTVWLVSYYATLTLLLVKSMKEAIICAHSRMYKRIKTNLVMIFSLLVNN